MFVYILLIGLVIFVLWIMLSHKSDPIIENKQIIVNAPQSDDTTPLCYPEGDYGRYPFILYEKKDRERRLYDSLTYDFYRY